MAMDKYKACIDLETRQDCPDRCVFPNCHDTCPGYESRCKEREEIRKKENESKWKPTAHDEQAWIKFYKRQKKNYKLFRR